MPALIVAFDGVLADTLGLRANAIVAACADERLTLGVHTAQDVMAGRSLDEAAVHLLRERPVANTDTGAIVSVDDTTLELVSLRAQRHYAARLAQGVTLHAAMRQQILDHSSAGHRIVVRADSLRRDVEPVIGLSDLEFHIAWLRCADDRASQPLPQSSPQRSPATHADSTFMKSWRAIDARLTAAQIPPAHRRAIESSSQNAVLASAFVHVDDS
jgi:beta-phosphoglucomutase-like phosphatase (HAD superfamily)